MNFKQGFKEGIPICLGYISVAFTFGITAVSSGLSVTDAVLISAGCVTSAGQFAGIALIQASSTLFEMACTQLVINIRYALMSISLSQKMDDSISLKDRFLIAFINTDEVFAVASSHQSVNRSYMFGLISSPYFGWILGTFGGAAVGSLLPQSVQSALGIAIYAMFIAIIIPPCRSNKNIIPVIGFAVLLSCLLSRIDMITSGFSIILCSIAASLLGALIFPLKEE